VSLELGPDPVNQGKSHHESPDQRIRIDRRTPVSTAAFAEDPACIGRQQSTPEDVNKLPTVFLT